MRVFSTILLLIGLATVVVAEDTPMWSTLVTTSRGDLSELTAAAKEHNWKGLQAEDDKAAEKLYWEGHQAGFAALMTNDKFRRAIDLDASKISVALSHIGTDHAEALYWSAQNLYDMGRVSDGDDRFMPKAMGEDASMMKKMMAKKDYPGVMEGFYFMRVRAMIDRLLELEVPVHYGSPYMLAGTFYASIPTEMGGNLDKAERYFQMAFEIERNYFRTKIHYAREYAVAKGDYRLFRDQLVSVLGTPADVLPEIAEEQLWFQEKAGMMLEDREAFFPDVYFESQQEAEEANESLQQMKQDQFGS